MPAPAGSRLPAVCGDIKIYGDVDRSPARRRCEADLRAKGPHGFLSPLLTKLTIKGAMKK